MKSAKPMKPMIFSTYSVQAILDGRKTQTRRVTDEDIVNGFDIDADGTICAYIDQATGDRFRPEEIAPYQPGDVIWVRETWRATGVMAEPYAYKADEEILTLIGEEGQLLYLKYNWRPSIHMPKEAARIFLLVKDAIPERLQDITVADAKAEGIRVYGPGCIEGLAFGCYNGDSCLDNTCQRPIELFRELWDSLNAKRGYPFESDPWVWKYVFERTDLK